MADTTYTAGITKIKAAWCQDINDLFYTLFGGPTISSQLFYLQDGQCNIGDYGTESNGISINGTTYSTKLRINDIGGNNPAQLVLHRHSTTWPSIIVGSRSNSDDNSHTAVSNSQDLLLLYGTGWTGTHYDLFSSIEFAASDTGTINDTSSPGMITLKTVADGSNTLSTVSILKYNFTRIYSEGTWCFQVDKPTTPTYVGLSVYDTDNTNIARVTVGAADSGGAGFKVLRIPN